MNKLLKNINDAIITGDAGKIAKARTKAQAYLAKHPMAACMLDDDELALIWG